MKNAETFEPTYETWPLAELKRHPQQNDVFTPPTEQEIARLAADIDQNGLKMPLEILPDGTVICGHSRLKALKVLGWTEVDVIVRHDLEILGQREVLNLLVNDNRNRRQLSKLEQVKAAIVNRGYASVLAKAPRDRIVPTDCKDELAKACGMERRNLDRWLRVLRTPDIVQIAASRELLTLESAGKIEGLNEAEQEELAELVKSYMDREAELGTKLRDELCQAVKRRLDRSVKPRRSHDAMYRLITALERALVDFGDFEKIHSLRGTSSTKRLATLQKARRLLKQITDTMSDDTAA